MLLSSADKSDLMSTVLPLPMGQSVTPSRGKMEGRDSSGSSLNMTRKCKMHDLTPQMYHDMKIIILYTLNKKCDKIYYLK